MAERLSVFITAPALPLRYTESGLVGIKPGTGRLGEDIDKFPPPTQVSIFEIDHAEQYLFPDPTSQEGFLVSSGGSLIELPPLRRLLTEAYHDEEKRKTICREVETAMEKACETTVVQVPIIEPVEVTILTPNPRTEIFNAIPLKPFLCELGNHGIFRLRAGDMRLVPNLNPYDVNISVPDVAEIDLNQVIPQRPDPMEDLSVPLAYSHTPGLQQILVKSLYAGAEKLVLAVRT